MANIYIPGTSPETKKEFAFFPADTYDAEIKAISEPKESQFTDSNGKTKMQIMLTFGLPNKDGDEEKEQVMFCSLSVTQKRNDKGKSSTLFDIIDKAGLAKDFVGMYKNALDSGSISDERGMDDSMLVEYLRATLIGSKVKILIEEYTDSEGHDRSIAKKIMKFYEPAKTFIDAIKEDKCESLSPETIKP